MLYPIATFSLKIFFDAFKVEILVNESYPDDFTSIQLKDHAHELPFYIGSVRADEIFVNQKATSELVSLYS